MILGDLLWHPAVPRALVVGAFGEAGLVLTMIYSRRGPLIFPVYAALLAALALLIARYPSVRGRGVVGESARPKLAARGNPEHQRRGV